ncbi:MAG TPA: VOC family protein [Acidimicrobiia bacterium]|nr:VOC family protein [Acidimicrobiia bacterium]HLE38314.1 VOC family protein [Acidimicrobiia bacterium]
MLDRFPVYAVLPAADLDRARTWWEEKAGMTPTTEDPGGLWYSCGEGTWVVITRSQFAGTARNTAITFKVEDVPATMADLRSKMVRFEDYDLPGFKTVDGLFEYGGYRAAWFKDSEGNIVEIAQVPSEPV